MSSRETINKYRIKKQLRDMNSKKRIATTYRNKKSIYTQKPKLISYYAGAIEATSPTSNALVEETAFPTSIPSATTFQSVDGDSGSFESVGEIDDNTVSQIVEDEPSIEMTGPVVEDTPVVENELEMADPVVVEDTPTTVENELEMADPVVVEDTPTTVENELEMAGPVAVEDTPTTVENELEMAGPVAVEDTPTTVENELEMAGPVAVEPETPYSSRNSIYPLSSVGDVLTNDDSLDEIESILPEPTQRSSNTSNNDRFITIRIAVPSGNVIDVQGDMSNSFENTVKAITKTQTSSASASQSTNISPESTNQTQSLQPSPTMSPSIPNAQIEKLEAMISDLSSKLNELIETQLLSYYNDDDVLPPIPNLQHDRNGNLDIDDSSFGTFDD